MTIPTNRITQWLSQLVQIPSVNPLGGDPSAGLRGEADMVDFLAHSFASLGGEVEQYEVAPGRNNIHGRWLGQSDRWVVLDVHTDTVGVSQMTDPPFDGRVAGGRLWGRGSVDTKASLGLILALIEDMVANSRPLKDNLMVVGTIGEEVGGLGAKAFAKWVAKNQMSLAQIMVAEPTMSTPLYGHKGVGVVKARILGKSAHSSKPHLGQNAIHAAAHVIISVEREHARLQALTPATELGNGTVAVTLVGGGTGHNIIPEDCTFNINRRIVPFEDADEVKQGLIDLVQSNSPLPVKIEESRAMPAFYQAPDSNWIQQLGEWSGRKPDVAPYGTNALSYNGIADEMVILGPGSIDQAHGEVEWVAISELEKTAAIYEKWLLAD